MDEIFDLIVSFRGEGGGEGFYLLLVYNKTMRWASAYCLEVTVQCFLVELQPCTYISSACLFLDISFYNFDPMKLKLLNSKTMVWSSTS